MELVEIVAVFVIILAIIVILVLLFIVNRPYSCKKKVKGQQTIFSLNANRDIARVEVVGKFNGESIKFERKNIKKGESIEFAYPASTEPASVTIEIEKGNLKTFEV